MRWVLWLAEEERHLVWMRAEEWPWKDIARRFACDRNTARRRWRKALGVMVHHLSEGDIGLPNFISS